MTYPRNPIAAVTHPDPYAYYADLVATQPLYYDHELELWVASSAEIVAAVLNNSLCRVRPLAEPVPKALLGSPAADIFRHLVRMNDGAGHCPFKHAMSATLASVNVAQAIEQSAYWARVLASTYVSKAVPDQLADFALHLPVYVVGSLLGVPPHMLGQVTHWVSDFVCCIAPTSTTEQIERGKAAAGQLCDTFRSLLTAHQTQPDRSLLVTLAREAHRVGRDDPESVVANGIGFLSQAYEATAGLIGNTLLALASHTDVWQLVTADRALLSNVILEVLRYDPPIQNTRRFLTHDGTVAGQDMRAGEMVLVVLAAANRDPQVNPRPAQFDVWRKDRRIFTFGLGAHACPGGALAPIIARAGIEQLLASGVVSPGIRVSTSYRPSANARIPIIAVHVYSGKQKH